MWAASTAPKTYIVSVNTVSYKELAVCSCSRGAAQRGQRHMRVVFVVLWVEHQEGVGAEDGRFWGGRERNCGAGQLRTSVFCNGAIIGSSTGYTFYAVFLMWLPLCPLHRIRYMAKLMHFKSFERELVWPYWKLSSKDVNCIAKVIRPWCVQVSTKVLSSLHFSLVDTTGIYRGLFWTHCRVEIKELQLCQEDIYTEQLDNSSRPLWAHAQVSPVNEGQKSRERRESGNSDSLISWLNQDLSLQREYKMSRWEDIYKKKEEYTTRFLTTYLWNPILTSLLILYCGALWNEWLSSPICLVLV